MTRFEYVVFGHNWSVEQKLQHDWNRTYVSTVLTSGCLGFGEATAGRKLHMLLHQQSVITGCKVSLETLRKVIKGVSTDQGSERKLAYAPNVSSPEELSTALDSCERGEIGVEEVSPPLVVFSGGSGRNRPNAHDLECI